MTNKRPRGLRKMKIDEISFCRLGASPGASVKVYKSAIHGEAYGEGLALLSGASSTVMNAFEKAIENAAELVDQTVVEKGVTIDDAAFTSLSCGVTALAKALAALDGEEGIAKVSDDFLSYVFSTFGVERSSAPTTNPNDGGLEKMANTTKTEADPNGTGTVEHEDKIDRKKDGGKKKKDGSLVPFDGGMTKSAEIPEGFIIMKAEEIDAVVSKAVSEAVVKAQAPLQEQISKMQAEKEDGERMAFAKSLCDGVPHATPKQVSSVLKALSGKGMEETLKGYIDGLNAQRVMFGKEFVPTGSDLSGGDAGTDPNAEIDRRVEARVKKASEEGKKISKAVAMAEVLDADPELFRRYQAASANVID